MIDVKKNVNYDFAMSMNTFQGMKLEKIKTLDHLRNGNISS